MFTVYYFNSCDGLGGVVKSASFFETRQEAEVAAKSMFEFAEKRGRLSSARVSIEENNENSVAKKIRKMAPTAAVYHLDDLLNEIDRLQYEVDNLKRELKELTKDQ